MADFDGRDNPNKPQRQWRNENPSSLPLKLALLAAAIICIIAIVIYWKARHQPPALHDILQTQPVNRPRPGSLRAGIPSFIHPLIKSSEVETWVPQRTAHFIPS